MIASKENVMTIRTQNMEYATPLTIFSLGFWCRLVVAHLHNSIAFWYRSLVDHHLGVYSTSQVWEFMTSIDYHSRQFVTNSPDALSNPFLIIENVAWLAWLRDALKYYGPWVVGSDATKVRQWLVYSNDFGSHVLGSVLPMEQCTVDSAKEIDEVIKNIRAKKAGVTQTRAIIAKVCLLIWDCI